MSPTRERIPGGKGLHFRTALLVALGSLLPLVVGAVLVRSAVGGLEERIVAERRSRATRAAHQLDDSLSLVAEAMIESNEPGSDRGSALQRILLRTGYVLGIEPSAPAPAPPGLPDEHNSVVVEPAGTLLFTVPTGPEGGEACRVSARIDPASRAFLHLLDPAEPREPSGSVDWIGSNGRILASTDPARVGRHDPHAALFAALRSKRGDDGGTCMGCHPSRSGGGPDELVAWAPLWTSSGAVVVRGSVSEIFAPSAKLRRSFLLLLPFLMAGIGLFAWGAARSLRRPLAKLTRAAEQIAKGDIATPIPPLPEDEIGRLGRSLERMRQSLADSIIQIEQANSALEARVAERTAELGRLYHELEIREERRARLLARLIGAQEDERKRIARELHDDTCQSVSALLLAVERSFGAGAKGDDNPAIAEIRAMTARTLDELHRLIFALRPSVLDDLGLASAIEWWVQKNLEPAGITARLEIEGLEEHLPPAEEITVYRTIQEALTNVLRHSKAENVLVQVERSPGRLAVEIEDDGVGFDPTLFTTPQPDGRGLGLAGMRERIELLGGKLRVDTTPGEGSLVAFEIPVGPAGGGA
jgi:signal transduction histidine kinase